MFRKFPKCGAVDPRTFGAAKNSFWLAVGTILIFGSQAVGQLTDRDGCQRSDDAALLQSWDDAATEYLCTSDHGGLCCDWGQKGFGCHLDEFIM